MRWLFKLVLCLCAMVLLITIVGAVMAQMLAIAIPSFGHELGFSSTQLSGMPFDSMMPYSGRSFAFFVNLAPVFVLILLIVVLVLVLPGRKERVKKDKTGSADDTRLIQELYRGFEGLEKRIESLETILLRIKQ